MFNDTIGTCLHNFHVLEIGDFERIKSSNNFITTKHNEKINKLKITQCCANKTVNIKIKTAREKWII